MENQEAEVQVVLASDTRKEIMRKLCEKSCRPADLSKELEKDRSTITEHLKMLSSAGLVERIEREGHKWVFYKLSRSGMDLFPNQRRRVIYVALSLFCLLGALGGFFTYFQESGAMTEIAAPKDAAGYEGQTLNAYRVEVAEAAPPDTSSSGDVYLYAALAFSVLFLMSLVQLALVKWNELVLPGNKQ